MPDVTIRARLDYRLSRMDVNLKGEVASQDAHRVVAECHARPHQRDSREEKFRPHPGNGRLLQTEAESKPESQPRPDHRDQKSERTAVSCLGGIRRFSRPARHEFK